MTQKYLNCFSKTRDSMGMLKGNMLNFKIKIPRFPKKIKDQRLTAVITIITTQLMKIQNKFKKQRKITKAKMKI